MSQKRIKNGRIPRLPVPRDYGKLGLNHADVAAIIDARAKAVVDRVVAECLDAIRQKPRTLRDARMVKKFELGV